MHREAQPHNSIFGIAWNSVLALMIVLLVLTVVVLFIVFTAQPAQGQTFQVIHKFTGGDGELPATGLTMDSAGNLYGTTSYGGTSGRGTVFKLSYSGSSWRLTTLYDFGAGDDGYLPGGRVTLAQDGTLYGTTVWGGGSPCYLNGCGIVFRLRPSPTAQNSLLAPWTETVLYRFTGGSDGAYPHGDLTWDQAGNIYGTATGDSGVLGAIYELTPSGGGWTFSVLYAVQNNGEGTDPFGGVVFDHSGNLYGAYLYNDMYGDGYGAVYELARSQSGWTERIIHEFTGGTDGGNPIGGLILGPSGNLYGTTTAGGAVFELTPSSGGWIFKTIYSFHGGGGSWDKLLFDAAGNLYGTTFYDGAYGCGTVFKLTPWNGDWIYTSLHDFACGADGAYPISNVIFDAAGNLYGTAYEGGINNNGSDANRNLYGTALDRVDLNCGLAPGCGVVWEITP